MDRDQERIGVLGGFARRARPGFGSGLARELRQLLLTPRIAEHDFMSSSRKERSELRAHQTRA